MNKLVVALIAGFIAAASAAQAPSQTVARQAAENSGNAQATAIQQAGNVGVSRETPKLSRSEKTRLAKDATRLNVNPENSSGQAATARMQMQTVAESKATAKQNAQFRSKEGKAQLDRELQSRSTP